jgi:hypothetical protein
MILKQWQMAIDILEQFRGTPADDTYDGITWNGIPFTEQELIDAYNGAKRSFWTPELILIRDKLLQDSDWTQGRDVTLSNDSEWQTYRQTLRDLTETHDPYIAKIIWPIKPGET